MFGLGSLFWDLWFGSFGLGSWACDLRLRILGLGSLVWDPWSGVFGSRSLVGVSLKNTSVPFPNPIDAFVE